MNDKEEDLPTFFQMRSLLIKDTQKKEPEPDLMARESDEEIIFVFVMESIL